VQVVGAWCLRLVLARLVRLDPLALTGRVEEGALDLAELRGHDESVLPCGHVEEDVRASRAPDPRSRAVDALEAQVGADPRRAKAEEAAAHAERRALRAERRRHHERVVGDELSFSFERRRSTRAPLLPGARVELDESVAVDRPERRSVRGHPAPRGRLDACPRAERRSPARDADLRYLDAVPRVGAVHLTAALRLCVEPERARRAARPDDDEDVALGRDRALHTLALREREVCAPQDASRPDHEETVAAHRHQLGPRAEELCRLALQHTQLVERLVERGPAQLREETRTQRPRERERDVVRGELCVQ
jgi:hypothetical protein